jgi:DNA primase
VVRRGSLRGRRTGVAGRIRNEDVAAVRERTDIVQLVSGYTQLRKAGRDSMVGICPFHAEKTGSFSVSPTKQVYYCFGCGEHGDVFKFVEKTENLSFVEAVERLASSAGVTLRYEGETEGGRRTTGRRNVIHKALGEAARMYHRMLLEGREATEARAYLEARKISKESTVRFEIGYAPGYPDYLLKRLSKSYSSDLLLEAGLVSKDANGAIRDRFRGRVMFPIHDVSSHAVGFGGRLLAGAGAQPNAAKYVNSPDGPVYHKGTLLYNLHRAKAEMTRSGRAFLVEGYTDVIALDQAGITGVVATCGTALGEDHVRLLARFADKALLSFDSDEAGARAAERAFQFHQQYPVDLAVLILPEGQDPADFVNASGGEAFVELAERAVPLVEYMIGRALIGRDLSTIEDRNRAVKAGLALLVNLEDPVRREEYARVLAGKLGEPERSVMLQLERTLNEGRTEGTAGERRPSPPTPVTRGTRLPPDEEVEREVLKLLLQAPNLCREWSDRITPDFFEKPTHRKAFELIAGSNGASHPNGSMSELLARAHEHGGEQLSRVVAAVAMEPPKSGGEPTRDYVERMMLRLEEFSLKRRADVVRKQLQKMNPVKSPDEYDRLFIDLAALEGARRRAREAAEAVGTAL